MSQNRKNMSQKCKDVSQNRKDMLQSRNFLRRIFATWRHVAKNRKKLQFFLTMSPMAHDSRKKSLQDRQFIDQLSSAAVLLPICNAESLGPLA